MPGTYWFLQDANYNVVAMLGPAPSDPNTWISDPNFQGGIPGDPTAPVVPLRQWVYEPYGPVVFADLLVTDPNLPAIPDNACGHQGLFYYRFVLDPADPNYISNPDYPGDPNDPENPYSPCETLADASLSPDTVGLYYNRARWYDPTFGRFCQRDMNATAAAVMTALVANGRATALILSGFSSADHYGDGMNLYAYERSNPASGRDPSGLEDPFEEVDSIIYGMAGERAAAAHHALATFGAMAQAVATGAVQAVLAAMFPPYGVYLSVQGAAVAIEDMMHNGVSWNNSALLGLSVVGGAASTAATVQEARWILSRISGAMRSGYRAVGASYAATNSARSGFAQSGRATAVNRIALLDWRRPSTLLYTERVSLRALEESGPFHNFPKMLDDLIVQQGNVTRGQGGYIQFNFRGVVNDCTGMYEIGGYIEGDTLAITHRFFRPG
jgi:RHS repeat-associated protein